MGTSRNWHQAIGGAQGEQDVVRLIREYAASLSPSDVERIPENCRPRPVESVDDVFDWGQHLRSEEAHYAERREVVQRLTETLAEAMDKLMEIRSRDD